jgi:outer membrane protein, heavy metal efflux system
MSSFRGSAFFIVPLTLPLLLGMGCRTSSRDTASHRVWSGTQQQQPHVVTESQTDIAVDSSVIRPVVNEETAPRDDAEAETALVHVESPLELDELTLPTLIAAVLDRNPSMHAAEAAWCAAAERYPQVIALDDPMLQTMLAPATLSTSSASQSSYYVGLAQRIPWHGKRSLRGQIAQWDAQAAAWDAAEVKLRLTIAAQLAFFDLYLVRKERELNRQNVDLMQEFRATAKAKYEANQVSEQDVSAADLELAKLEQTRFELEQSERIAVARINTLLHRAPDHPLPAPPRSLDPTIDPPDVAELREVAIKRRPELAALAAKIQSEQNALALACKEYFPDFEVMGRYDAFWTDPTQRSQVGMNMNLPLNHDRRGAAVREAQHRLRKLVAELAQQQDSVREEVQIAYSRVLANHQATQTYSERIMPAAQTNMDAARAAYIAGTIDFLRLMEARKQFVEQQMAFQRTLTEYHRSRAELQRSVGADHTNAD